MSFDFDMCDGYGCGLRDTCKRYRGYMKAENVGDYPIYLIVHDKKVKERCRLYWPV